MEILKSLNERELDVLRDSFQLNSMHSLNEDEFVSAIEKVCTHKKLPFKLTRRYLTTLFANADVTGSNRLSWDAFSMFVIHAALNATATNITINADTDRDEVEELHKHNAIYGNSSSKKKCFMEALSHEYGNRYAQSRNSINNHEGINHFTDHHNNNCNNSDKLHLPQLTQNKKNINALNEIKAPTVLPISKEKLHRTLSFSSHTRRLSRRNSQMYMDNSNLDNGGFANANNNNPFVASPRGNAGCESKVDYALLQSVRSRRASYQRPEEKEEFVFDVDDHEVHEINNKINGNNNNNMTFANTSATRLDNNYSTPTRNNEYSINNKEFEASCTSSITVTPEKVEVVERSPSVEGKSNASVSHVNSSSNACKAKQRKLNETEESDEFTSFRPYHVAGCSSHP